MIQIKRKYKKNILRQNEIFLPDQTKFEYLTYPMLSEIECIGHLFSTRIGGVSEDIFSTMNLSFTRGDDPERVMENYRRIAYALSKQTKLKLDLANFVTSDQTHTTNVVVATKGFSGYGITSPRPYTDVDGLITNERGLILSTFYADCVPLYFVDPVKKVIGLSHSGWKGTAGRMGEVTIQKMQKVYGCQLQDIRVAIGPSICQDCYEVSEDLYDAFSITFDGDEQILSDIFIKKENHKYQLDLWKANRYVLLQTGILPEHIQGPDICTCCNPDYLFSHRASQGKRGNLGAFLVLK